VGYAPAFGIFEIGRVVTGMTEDNLCVEKKKLAITLYSKTEDVKALYFKLRDILAVITDDIKHKTLGFVSCGAVIALGTAFCSIKTSLMWTMPMANSIIWLHFTKYFRVPEVSITFSVVYLVTFVAALIIFCYIMIGRFNYDNVSEIAS
jgi:lysylphosphatidylglycerol synthetase-like protein (DUF2156 family)